MIELQSSMSKHIPVSVQLLSASAILLCRCVFLCACVASVETSVRSTLAFAFLLRKKNERKKGND